MSNAVLPKTAVMANGKWFGILSHFGVDHRFLRDKHGPCPLCDGGRDRWRWDNKDGNGTYFCNHCGSGDGMTLLMRLKGWDFKRAAAEVDKIIGNIEARPQPTPKSPAARLRRIGMGLQSARGSINPVRLYLRRRGISQLPGESLKLHPSLAYWEEGKKLGEYPAMVALVQGPDGRRLTYHITYLTQEGAKAPVSAVKKLASSPGSVGAAIRLGPIAPHIGIAEGIETALAAKAIHGFDCWAVVNATMMEQFVPPAGVKWISICGDNDKSFTGQKSAYALARRLTAEGYRCQVLIPDAIGSDWADVLHMESKEAQA